jgi:hypothetical protein
MVKSLSDDMMRKIFAFSQGASSNGILLMEAALTNGIRMGAGKCWAEYDLQPRM